MSKPAQEQLVPALLAQWCLTERQQEDRLGNPERTTSYEMLIIILNADGICEKSMLSLEFGTLG